ncbi:Myb domain protein 4r1 [Mycena kentingensis (nom. inval.)]|nr:Myb domain protein 4r1 [Mycena kentingensis (nom. inval.)]
MDSARPLAVQTLHQNQHHQYLLAAHVRNLEEELAELDKLLPQADIADDDDTLEPDFYIPDSATPVWPIRNFLHANSPFSEDASKRTRYFNSTTRRMMAPKEIEALKAAVNSETKRIGKQAGSSTMVTSDMLNWATIAEKVSDSSSVTRTAMECKIKWRADFSSEINRKEWGDAELASLNAILNKIPEGSKVDWTRVAKDLGTDRLPSDCLRHGFERPRFSWDEEGDRKLVDAVAHYGQCWPLVAKYVSPNVTAAICASRWQRCGDSSLRSGAWSEEEDKRLKAAVEGFGLSWVEVASAVPGRTNEQCRERWMKVFDGKSKSKTKTPSRPWTDEEDKALTDAIASLGTKWKEVGETIGRSAGQCQGRYKRLQKSSHSTPVSSEEEDEDTSPPPLRRTGQTRKSVALEAEQGPPDTASSSSSTRPKPRPLARGTKRVRNDNDDLVPRPEASEPRRRSSRLNK